MRNVDGIPFSSGLAGFICTYVFFLMSLFLCGLYQMMVRWKLVSDKLWLFLISLVAYCKVGILVKWWWTGWFVFGAARRSQEMVEHETLPEVGQNVLCHYEGKGTLKISIILISGLPGSVSIKWADFFSLIIIRWTMKGLMLWIREWETLIHTTKVTQTKITYPFWLHSIDKRKKKTS